MLLPGHNLGIQEEVDPAVVDEAPIAADPAVVIPNEVAGVDIGHLGAAGGADNGDDAVEVDIGAQPPTDEIDELVADGADEVEFVVVATN